MDRLSPEHSTDTADNTPEDANATEDDVQPEVLRFCSVKGCEVALPPNYGNKMCEACKQRHRLYAITKRAKRRMEKGIPEASSASTVLDTALRGAQEPITSEADALQCAFPEITWDSSVLDPLLLHEGVSGVASTFALSPSDTGLPSVTPGPEQPNFASNDIPAGHSQPSLVNSSASTSFQPPLSIETLDKAASQLANLSTIPPRFCSTKGCKAVLPGSRYYKMCDSCIHRFKNYRRRKQDHKDDNVDVHEMESQHVQCTAPSQSEWPFDLSRQSHSHAAHISTSQNTPRFCTVSHCREALDPSESYRRCELHRSQNKRHSNLKRLRDKETKAMIVAKWVATKRCQPELDVRPGPHTRQSAGDVEESPVDPTLSQSLPHVEAHIAPPDMRGIRRTNLVCLSKTCQNVLSPELPWKTCEACRERRRARHRIRIRTRQTDEATDSCTDSGTVAAPIKKRKTRKSSSKTPSSTRQRVEPRERQAQRGLAGGRNEEAARMVSDSEENVTDPPEVLQALLEAVASTSDASSISDRTSLSEEPSDDEILRSDASPSSITATLPLLDKPSITKKTSTSARRSVMSKAKKVDRPRIQGTSAIIAPASLPSSISATKPPGPSPPLLIQPPYAPSFHLPCPPPYILPQAYPGVPPMYLAPYPPYPSYFSYMPYPQGHMIMYPPPNMPFPPPHAPAPHRPVQALSSAQHAPPRQPSAPTPVATQPATGPHYSTWSTQPLLSQQRDSQRHAPVNKSPSVVAFTFSAQTGVEIDNPRLTRPPWHKKRKHGSQDAA